MEKNSKLGFTFALITHSSRRKQHLSYRFYQFRFLAVGKIHTWRKHFLSPNILPLSHCFRENTLSNSVQTLSNSNILYNLISDIISIVSLSCHLKFKSNSWTELQRKTKVFKDLYSQESSVFNSWWSLVWN